MLGILEQIQIFKVNYVHMNKYASNLMKKNENIRKKTYETQPHIDV